MKTIKTGQNFSSMPRKLNGVSSQNRQFEVMSECIELRLALSRIT